MKRPGFHLLLLCLALAACTREIPVKILVLTDSTDPGSAITEEYLLPYLDHFGIAYETADLAKGSPDIRPSDYALLLAGQDFEDNRPAGEILRQFRGSGAGFVSFDPDLRTDPGVAGEDGPGEPAEASAGEGPAPPAPARWIAASQSHYITGLHLKGDTLRCFSPMKMPAGPYPAGQILLSASGFPLLVAAEEPGMKTVFFTSAEWMRSEVLGPLMGMDDCLWRAMVWAARKPFVMRGLPPLVTMRVDDVMGTGKLWDRSPFYWVKVANDYGFKPWLGLFIYNLDPDAIDELRTCLLDGQATAAPHAFGSPNRTGVKTPEEAIRQAKYEGDYRGCYYNPEAMPLRSGDYDEFIFFDHHNGKPWSDEEARRGLEAVDQWYEKHQPLPKSRYFLAHWYEMGSNVIGHVAGDWGMEFIGMNKDIDLPWADSVPWIRGGPFRKFESPRTSTNNPDFGGTNPVYYADFVTVDGHRFFNCFTEIRDGTGYEWYPDNDVLPSARRGIRQLRRALSSMAMAVLFTHENGTIYEIEPANWDAELRLIREGISEFDPMMVTTEDAVRIVRAHQTSRLSCCSVTPAGKLYLTFTGNADTVTCAYCFTQSGDRIVQQRVEVPSFEKSYRIKISDP